MEQTQTFKVVSPVAGFEAGTTIASDELPEGINIDALVQGGHLELVSSSLLACPACAEQGIERKAKSAETLAKHYEKDHPGLVPPNAGEEE